MMPDFKGKRIAALDVGTKRIGYATCDEYHVAVTPRLFFDATKEDLIDVANEFNLIFVPKAE